MSLQGNVKRHGFQKQELRSLIFMFYFDFSSYDDSVCKKLEKVNHKFNNKTHSFLNRDFNVINLMVL